MVRYDREQDGPFGRGSKLFLNGRAMDTRFVVAFDDADEKGVGWVAYCAHASTPPEKVQCKGDCDGHTRTVYGKVRYVPRDD